MVVEHWLYEAVRGQYAHVVEYGGAGDQGRDRAGYVARLGSDPWDNYQCKQYNKKLGPSDLLPELGKLVFHVTRGSFTTPRRYAFVAPKGFGPTAIDLLADPERIRSRLKRDWAKHCAVLCPLAEIGDALDGFAFPEFEPISGGRIIDDLSSSPIYPHFFGGGLTKPRPADTVPPEEIAAHELPYISQLVAAYDDHCSAVVDSVETALGLRPYGDHLRDSRRDFYCAESLREFTRDAFPHPDTFAELQTLLYDGIKFTLAKEHPSGYDRVIAVCEQAVTVQLGDHALAPEVNPPDRSGICHQLANEDRVQWVP